MAFSFILFAFLLFLSVPSDISPLSFSVARGARRALDAMADSKDPSTRLAGFEYVKIDTHIPILDLPIEARNRSNSSRLSNAVIQGLVVINVRDYLGIFDDLIASLQSV